AVTARLAAASQDQAIDQAIATLILTDNRLAENAAQRGDPSAAATWLGDAMNRSDDLAARSGTDLTSDGLDTLWLSAELAELDGAKPSFDVAGRLQRAQAELEKRHDAHWRSYQRWFEILLALQQP
ncbi:MAG TPA: hypothetical protein VMB50_05300, partial [Myxococcales bacterium]|nr:hypothetical protein [Myxococcales bacterium]